MKNTKKIIAILLSCSMLAAGLMTGCGSSDTDSAAAKASASAESSVAVEAESTTSQASSSTDSTVPAEDIVQREDYVEVDGLTYTGSLKLDYATQFSLDFYEGGYGFITIGDGEEKFLVVPENGSVPDSLDADVVVLQKPFHDIYLAATALMSLFCSMDALEPVSMTSLEESGWTYEAPKKAMEAGDIVYAGKYSEPDYELLLANNCDLAIESTMIYHTPEVQEMIEDLDIPVLVDNSSYESNPLGRAEWIKLYAFMTDHMTEADTFFAEQEEKVSSLDDYENTGKTVAFFYISSDNKAVVRASTDYVPTMIEMAGGNYIFKDLTDASGKSSIDMSIETFYDTAADADYIIYNGSIDSQVKTLDDLIAKDPIMENFKAVKEGNCWTTGNSMYQRPDTIGDMVLDLHEVLTDENASDLDYLTKLE